MHTHTTHTHTHTHTHTDTHTHTTHTHTHTHANTQHTHNTHTHTHTHTHTCTHKQHTHTHTHTHTTFFACKGLQFMERRSMPYTWTLTYNINNFNNVHGLHSLVLVGIQTLQDLGLSHVAMLNIAFDSLSRVINHKSMTWINGSWVDIQNVVQRFHVAMQIFYYLPQKIKVLKAAKLWKATAAKWLTEIKKLCWSPTACC